MNSGTLKRAAKKLREVREDRMTPQVMNAGDTYIVEFPKSGVTWLTMLIANGFVGQFGSGSPVTFGSVRRVIPDLHASRAVAPRLSQDGTGFYKSHTLFNRNYTSTIYLVRHPWNVMKSFHRYRSHRAGDAGNLATFLADEQHGIPAWKEHVHSWLMASRDSAQRQLHLVRYEDLIDDAAKELADLNNNFGWGLSEENIALAVKRSSRDVMRAQEELYTSRNPQHKMTFVGPEANDRSGEGDADTLRQRVESECREELKFLGYR